MKKRKKKKKGFNRVLLLILVVGVILGLFYYRQKKQLQVVTIVSQIDNYNYYLESNTTTIYRKYYQELEKELKNASINEKGYASLVAQLFVIDYYTLDNKVTNKNIGGVQFIHSQLKDKFITESSNTVYKYVRNNLYGNRKQKLPEVTDVKIDKITEIRYHYQNYQDKKAYEVVVKVKYAKDYDYPKEVTLKIIHEDIKLAIVEIK